MSTPESDARLFLFYEVTHNFPSQKKGPSTIDGKSTDENLVKWDFLTAKNEKKKTALIICGAKKKKKNPLLQEMN